MRVELGTAVTAVEPDGVVLADGRRLDSQLTAVVGPLRGPGLGLPAGLTGPSGFIPVDEWLHPAGHPEVTVIGAAAELTAATNLPKTWAFARRQATTAAANLVADAAGQPARPFDLDAARLAAVRLPDLAGATVLVRSGRLLAHGRIPLLLRARLDKQNIRALCAVPPPSRRR